MIWNEVPVAAAIVMLKLATAVCAVELESRTWAVKEELPDAVGVPLIWPEEESVRPAGNEPEVMDQL